MPATAAEWAQARAALLAASALGFDTESKPIFRAARTTAPTSCNWPHPVLGWVLQLRHPQARRWPAKALARRHITKSASAWTTICAPCPSAWAYKPANVLDLDKVFRHHGFRHNTGVRAAMAIVLQRSFSKSKRTSTSNWATPTLSPAQVRYAANDAHAPALIHAALPAWQASSPAAPSKPAAPQKNSALTTSPTTIWYRLAPTTLAPSCGGCYVFLHCCAWAWALSVSFLPGLPTTVFILMASWPPPGAAYTSTPWPHRHKLFGPMLRNWRPAATLSRRAKYSGHHHGVERRHLVVAGPALVSPRWPAAAWPGASAVAVAQTRTTQSNRKKLKNFPTLLRKPKFHAYRSALP